MESLRLVAAAAVAKLPPLLNCVRAKRQLHRKKESGVEDREVAAMGSEAGLGRWIWMLAESSQMVKIKGKQ